MITARRIGLRARVGLVVGAMGVACAAVGGVCSCAWADDVPAALVESVQTLLGAQGRDWLASRDAFLQLPEAERAAALEYLARADATKEERTLAVILRTRIERPDEALDYDDGIRESLHNKYVDNVGRPALEMRPLAPEIWALGVEVLWKRSDIPEHIRRSPVHALPVQAVEIDAALVLLRALPEVGGAIAAALVQVSGAASDARVYQALTEAYRDIRSAQPDSAYRRSQAAGVLLAAARLGTPEAIAAVKQMEECERALMTARGAAPWNDRGEAKRELEEASRARALAIGLDYASRKEQLQKFALVNAHAQQAMEAWLLVLHWRQFERSYTMLGLLGAPVDPPPAAVIDESAQALLDAEGQDWLALRDAFLQLPDAERAAALEYLARADATKEEKTLALILRTHIERPDDVAAFEQGLERDLTSPAVGRDGKPIYGHYAPRLNPENYGLSIEHIWKRGDLQQEIRTYPYSALPHWVRETDSLLVLLERDPNQSPNIALALAAVPNSGSDPRVPVAMLAAYQRARTQHPPNSNAARIVMLRTASMGTPQARDVVLQMHAIERNLMIQQGKAPWNDQGEAKAGLREATKERSRARNLRFADEAQRAAALDSLEVQRAEALERCSEVLLWQAYADAYQRLRSAGVPVEAPPDP